MTDMERKGLNWNIGDVRMQYQQVKDKGAIHKMVSIVKEGKPLYIITKGEKKAINESMIVNDYGKGVLAAAKELLEYGSKNYKGIKRKEKLVNAAWTIGGAIVIIGVSALLGNKVGKKF